MPDRNSVGHIFIYTLKLEYRLQTNCCFAIIADFGIDSDTSDPLFLLRDNAILTETDLSYGHDILRLGQAFSYGLNDRLSVSGRVHYQVDFAGSQDGFSSIDLGGAYRLARAEDNNAQLISDVVAGFRFAGSKHVRTPWFADSSYYAGLRFGRQWAGVTLLISSQNHISGLMKHGARGWVQHFVNRPNHIITRNGLTLKWWRSSVTRNISDTSTMNSRTTKSRSVPRLIFYSSLFC